MEQGQRKVYAQGLCRVEDMGADVVKPQSSDAGDREVSQVAAPEQLGLPRL